MLIMKQTTENHTIYKLITPISIGAGLIVTVFGALGLIGWYTHTYILVQISSQFAPMQYNTALAFFFLGLNLLFVIKYPRLSALLSIMVFLLGALTLIQYIFYINVGIDQLFLKTVVLAKTSNPGRMAPNTALCLMLASSAIFFNLDVISFPSKRYLAIVFSALTMALGFIALIGYLADLPTAYGWGKLTGMNIISAFCFTMAGIGLSALSFRYFIHELTGRNFIPILIIVVGCVFFILLWQSLVADQNQKMILKVKDDAEQIKTEIDEKVMTYNLALARMEKRMDYQNYASQTAWLYDAKLYLDDMKPYQAIIWMPEGQATPWIAVNNNITLTNLDKQKLQSCLHQAQMNTMPNDFMIMVPPQQNLEQFCIVRYSAKGYLVGLVNMQAFLKDTFSDLNDEYYQIMLSKNNNNLEIHHAIGQVLSNEWMIVLPLSQIDEQLKLSVQPTDEFLQKKNSILPIIALIVGSLLTLLLALALRFWIVANHERKELAEAIKNREALDTRFQAITVSANDAIIMLDKVGRIVFWNEAAIQMFGYLLSEVSGQFYYNIIIPPRYIEAQKKEFEHFLITGEGPGSGKNFEMTAITKNGTEFPVEVSISTVTIDDKWEGIAVMRDITERKKSNAIIQHQANYDALTDLPNRILFYERLKLSVSNADRLQSWVSLLSMDLDGFKSVNDTYGHEVGDEVLKEVSHRLLQCIRQTDTATRLGGDEFAIILTNIHNKTEISLVAQNIIDQLSQPYNIGSITVMVTASIGITIYPVDAADQKELLTKADHAMYMAKKSGRNKFCFFA